MANEDDSTKPGRRKDGQPYKDGNTREDGSYDVGHGRTPAATRFAKDDGRQRGRRPKGVRNLATEWREELAETIEIGEGGKRKTVSKMRGIVKATAAKAMKGSERAAEIAFRYGAAADVVTGKLRMSDAEIIGRWLPSSGLGSAEPMITDDYDEQQQQEAADELVGADAERCQETSDDGD